MVDAMKLALCVFLAHLFAQVVLVCSTDFLIVSPRVYRPGTRVKHGVNLFGDKACEVVIRLYDGNTVISSAKGFFRSNKPGELELEVPSNATGRNLLIEAVIYHVDIKEIEVFSNATGRNLLIKAMIPRHVDKRTKRVSLQVQTDSIFIQTDKPIYKPGQKVLIRIISMNSELKPVGSEVTSVAVEEPSGSKIMQWNNVKLEDGIASLDLQLSKEPVLGKWKIKAVIGEISTTEEIEIAKYVLPKYNVVIKPPKYVALDQKDVTTSICARYTYGKPVKGLLVATLCLKEQWTNYLAPWPCHKITRNITGCTEITLTRADLKFSSLQNYRYNTYLHINASVTETLTGVKLSTEASTSRIVEKSVQLQFSGTSDRFKPGLPFKFTVCLRSAKRLYLSGYRLSLFEPPSIMIKVTHLDGAPVTTGEVHVKISRGLFYYVGTRNFYNKTFSVKNGVVSDVINDMPPNANILHLQASLPSRNLRAYHTSKAWYSPSLSYIQLIKKQQTPTKVNEEGSILVRYTFRRDMANVIDFHYKILCKGNIVQSGIHSRRHGFNEQKTAAPTTTGFNIRATSLNPDVSNTTTTTTGSGAESGKPATTLPTTTGSGAESDEPPTTLPFGPPPLKNIPKAIVKEFVMKFNVTQEMVPFCRVLIYYLHSREVVADSIVYDVDDSLENQVSVDFMDEKKKPGQKTKLILKAKPGSRVAISAIDQSVLLLKNGNEIRKSEVMSVLNHLDVGRTEGYDDRCYRWARKRHDADASEAFNTAGVVFLSNLDIFTQSCYADWHLSYNEDTDWPVLPTTVVPTALQFRRTQIVGTIREGFKIVGPVPFRTTTRPPKPNPKPVRVRQKFPETWLWADMKLNDTTGVKTMEVQVPDTITTWIANGFAMSSSYGIGVSPQTSIKAFQPFFVQMTLPYSVIRGEELPVTVTVFNYMTTCVPIRLELNDQSPDYKLTSYHISKLCVCGDAGKSVKFNIIPKKLGYISLTVKAQTSAAKLCPNATVAASDAVTRKLLVEAEGIKQEYTKGTFFCSEAGYNETFDLGLPNDVIPGSVFATVSVVGDIMGPALSNLDRLLAMPYGCGEQNMAKFAPNIYIMDYLTNTNQVTQKVKDEALRFMRSGYQRELTYKRLSGSYSAFGDRDQQGSMMLTAFVVRSFARAKNYIFVDAKEVEHSMKWFKRKQLESGCFPNYGKVFSRQLQGGLNSELTITAYVTLALLEAGQNPKSPMVSSALACIARQINSYKDSYTTALVTYTLVLANHPKAGEMIKVLKNKAFTKDGQMYWSAISDGTVPTTPPPFLFWYYPTPSADIEMTGYALMALLKHGGVSKDISKIVKWLTKQRNAFGGFSSTQDTCVALQALSEVAEKFYQNSLSNNVRVSTKITDVFSHDFTITDVDKLVLQRVELQDNFLPNKLEVTAKGPGCALFQATVKYNVPTPKEVPAFKVNVDVRRRRAAAEEENTACHPLQLKITAKWLKQDVSNMAIVDIKLVSGFTVNEESLKRLVNDPTVKFKRYDIDGQNVMLYFDEIKDISFSIDILQSTLVKKIKPAVVRVYDYYNPESQAKVMYEITEKDCYGEKIEKECPKCISIDDIGTLFDHNISCSSYLMRAKSKNGMILIKKAYIKTDDARDRSYLPYEIPEFCRCDEIYEGVASLMIAQNNCFKESVEGSSIVLNSETIIAKYSGKKMRKVFQKKMWKMFRCSRG